MVLIVDQNSGVPVYRQIIDQIRFIVASGMAKPGEELPSTRALSQQLGVNPMTVSKAYSLLEEEGLIERRPGLPLVVRKRSGRSADQTRNEQLRTVLEPAAAAVRQLEIPTQQAVKEFRALLDNNDVKTEKSA
jgi:GntR family transcriptional regulator